MPRLTEQEQQDIIRYIEAGRPLPDKYHKRPLSGVQKRLPRMCAGEAENRCEGGEYLR